MRRSRQVSAVLAAAIAVWAATAAADGAWTLETVEGGISLTMSIVVDPAGVPHLAYNYAAQPRYATRTDQGWTTESLVTPPSLAVPSVESRSGGQANPYLIYFVTTSLALDPTSGEPRIAYSKAPEYAVWYAERAADVWSYHRLLAQNGSDPALTIDPQGRPHVVFTGFMDGPHYAVRTAGNWDIQPILNGGATDDLRLDSQGRPRVAGAVGAPNADLRFGGLDGGVWAFEDGDTTGDTGYAASLALDAADDPHIAYYDRTLQAVRYAHRAAGVWSVETVAPSVGSFGHCSIALDPGGRPWVAYYDAGPGDLRFARRDGGVWTSEPVETAGDVGLYCALAIDGAARPHIAYYDATNFRVRYALNGPLASAPARFPATGFAIGGVSPNPVVAGRAVRLELRADGPRRVDLELLDLAGRSVARRATGELVAGTAAFPWAIQPPAPGIYFVRARSDRGEVVVSRIAVVR